MHRVGHKSRILKQSGYGLGDTKPSFELVRIPTRNGAAEVAVTLHDPAPAGHQLNNQHYQCHNQQDVNQTSSNMKAEPQKP